MKYLYLSFKHKHKFRNPNIDFIRIIGMLAIIVHHLLLHGRIFKKYNKYKQLNLLNIICNWHVSSFAIISGLLGHKSFKYSNLLFLWIQTLFYSITFSFIFNKFIICRAYNYYIVDIFPVIYKRYWYVTAYFGIYPLLPFINSGLLAFTQIEIKKIIYFMIVIFIIWSSVFIDSFSQHNGKSPFSILIFYIIGAYIGKYCLNIKIKAIHRILIYILCFFLFVIVSIICYYIHTRQNLNIFSVKLKKLLRISINSFPMLNQIFAIVIFVSQINFNQYIIKIISFIAPLTFDVYLIHDNPYIRNNYIRNLFNKESIDLNLASLIFLIIQKTFIIFLICIYIAYIRSKIFSIFKIKLLCCYIELLIIKIIYYLI